MFQIFNIYAKEINMSLIVTVYTSEGIIMASDSRASFSFLKQSSGQDIYVPSGNYYDTADKTFLTPNNHGISACGEGSINNIPLSGLIKTFVRTQISPTDTVFETSKKLLAYIKNLNKAAKITFHILGFDNDPNGNKIISGYRMFTNGEGSVIKMPTENAGASWNGETQTISRILNESCFIKDLKILPVNTQITIPLEKEEKAILTLKNESFLIEKANLLLNEKQDIPWNLMSIQDGIDFAEYAIRTTIDTMKFVNSSNSVGGPIDLLVITPEKAEWVKKKKSYY